MKLFTFSPVLALSLLVLAAGCSRDSEEVISGPQPSAGAVSIEAAAPVPPPAVVAPTGAAVAPPPDAATMKRPLNAQGEAMSDLELLNHLVEQVNESRAAGGEFPQKAFKTEAEQLAYEEAQQQRKGPVRDLNDLVVAGVIKALPQAPAGQRYAIDATTGKVILQ